MATTTKAFPGFTPGENRPLIAEVSHWLHASGWAIQRDTGWQNPSRLTQVDWDERGLFIGHRTDTDRVWSNPTHYPATSVRQAVDMLAVIGILPVAFSSAYRQGRSDAAFIENVDTTPDRRCRKCGATSALVQLPSNPLVVAPTEWECINGCADEQSGR